MPIQKFNLINSGYNRVYRGHQIGQDSGPISVLLPAHWKPVGIVNSQTYLQASARPIDRAAADPVYSAGIHITNTDDFWDPYHGQVSVRWMGSWANTEQELSEFYVTLDLYLSYEIDTGVPFAVPFRILGDQIESEGKEGRKVPAPELETP